MTSKLLLSTLATAALVFSAPAYSGEGKDHAHDKKEHAKCDPAKDKNCKDDHKDGHKEGEGHGGKDDHKHDKK